MSRSTLLEGDNNSSYDEYFEESGSSNPASWGEPDPVDDDDDDDDDNDYGYDLEEKDWRKFDFDDEEVEDVEMNPNITSEQLEAYRYMKELKEEDPQFFNHIADQEQGGIGTFVTDDEEDDNGKDKDKAKDKDKDEGKNGNGNSDSDNGERRNPAHIDILNIKKLLNLINCKSLFIP